MSAQATHLDIIPLKTGATMLQSEVRSYFDGLFRAEKSGDPFPVDIDDVWPFAFTRKDAAKRAILDDATLEEGRDYILHKNVENSRGAPSQSIYLSTDCTEIIFATRSRPIFRFYQECRRIVQGMAHAVATAPEAQHDDLSDLLRKTLSVIERDRESHQSLQRVVDTLGTELALVRHAMEEIQADHSRLIRRRTHTQLKFPLAPHKPRSNADKRRDVRLCLVNPDMMTWSNVRIALECQVSPSMVRTARLKMQRENVIPPTPCRRGVHDRVLRVTNIGFRN